MSAKAKSFGDEGNVLTRVLLLAAFVAALLVLGALIAFGPASWLV